MKSIFYMMLLRTYETRNWIQKYHFELATVIVHVNVFLFVQNQMKSFRRQIKYVLEKKCLFVQFKIKQFTERIDWRSMTKRMCALNSADVSEEKGEEKNLLNIAVILQLIFCKNARDHLIVLRFSFSMSAHLYTKRVFTKSNEQATVKMCVCVEMRMSKTQCLV